MGLAKNNLGASFFFFPRVGSDVRFRGFQDVAGVRIWVFKNPTDARFRTFSVLTDVLQGVIGPPSKNTILGSLHKCTPRICRFLEKSAVFPPGGWPSGGKTRAFFQKSAKMRGAFM